MNSNNKYTHPINTKVFELKNPEGKTIVDLILEKDISFAFGDRQHILCYLNSIYKGTPENAPIIEKILSNSEAYDPERMDEYLQTQMQVTDWKLYFILKRHGIDVREFGISVKAFDDNDQQDIEQLEEGSNAKITAEDLLRIHKDYKPEFLVKPLVFKNGLNILGAERGTGKTRLCLSLACHLTYGLESYLGYPANPGVDVLYINMELPGREFSSMLKQIWSYFDRNHSKIGEFYPLNTRDHSDLTVKSIGDYIAEVKPGLVIIDSFKVFINKILVEERQQSLTNETLSAFFKFVFMWIEKYDTTILLTNHTNKGTSNNKSHTDMMYGPGGLFDLADHTSLVRRAKIPNQRIIVPDKGRFTPDGIFGANLIAFKNINEEEEIIFELIEEDVDESEYRAESKSSQRYPADKMAKAYELNASGKSTREIGKEVGVHHATVARWIKKLENAKDPF